jgi:putative DNA-invertase from lambdoid prophage Rac
MAATAQTQAESTKEAQRTGIAHARANGHERGYKGRKPELSREQFESARKRCLEGPQALARSRGSPGYSADGLQDQG